MNVVDAIAKQARARPDAPAIHGPARSITYGELIRRVDAVAAALAARDVKPGEVVAIGGRPIDFVCATLGVAWLGGTSVSINDMGADDVEHTISRTAAAAVICEPGMVPSMPQCVRTAASCSELLAAAAAPIAVHDCKGDEIWRIGFSSGTTGRRKEMLFSHRSAIAKTELLSSVPEILGERTMVHVGYTVTFGLSYWLRELSRGASVVLGVPPKLAPAAIKRFEVDLLIASPGNALTLLNNLQAAGERAPVSLKTLMLGGAPVSPAQRKLLRERVCDNLWVNYGATEVGLVALLDPKLMDSNPASAGRLMPWVECESTVEGTLRMRAPSMASGYLLSTHSSEADRHAFDRGWFRSSDRGRVEEGLLYLEARSDDLLNIGGHKLDPTIVQRAIEALPGVLECAVTTVESEGGSPVLVAFVAPEQPALDAAAVRAHCARSLAGWQVPAVVVQVPELPRNAAGKVDRARLSGTIKLGT